MSRRRFAQAAAVLLALTFGLPAGAGVEGPQRFVTVDGRRLVAPDGQTLLLKGINLGNWLMPEGYMFKFKKAKSPRRIREAVEHVLGPSDTAVFWQTFRERYITRDDIRLISSLGFNTVRIPLHWGLFMSADDPPVIGGDGWPLLDRLIGWAGEAGLRVVIDLHAAPGGQTGINHDDGSGYPLMFYVPRHQRATIALWREIASRYRDEPVVLGYDILNEPIAPFHDVALLNPRLERMYRRIVAAIRTVDPEHLVFLNGAQWATSFAMFGPPFDDRLVYTYHKFWSATTRQAIAEYIDFRNRHDVPIWLGESGELTDAWTREFRELHERHGIGWSFWTYKNLDTGSSVVTIPRPAGWDAVISIADGGAATAPGGAALAGPAELDGAAAVQAAQAALAAYLRNIELGNCAINRGYVEALGLRVPHDTGLPDAGPPTTEPG